MQRLAMGKRPCCHSKNSRELMVVRSRQRCFFRLYERLVWKINSVSSHQIIMGQTMSCYAILQRRLRTSTLSFVECDALAITSIVLRKHSFLDLQQSKERDNGMRMMQLRWLFRIWANFKKSFEIKEHEVKKMLPKSFASMAALANFTTAMSSLALLPLDIKPSLRQLDERFRWTMTRGGTPGWMRSLLL